MKKIDFDMNTSGEWFYMNTDEITVRAIYDCLVQDTSLDLEIWEDAGVLEVNYTDKTSLDFEMLRPFFKDKEGDAYLKSNNIRSLFMVNFDGADFSIVKPMMKCVVLKCGGYFIEDNMDFRQSMIVK